MKKLLLALLCLTFAATSFGADIYVSQTTGKKSGPGTQEAPFKAIFDALKVAKPGDTIRMAQGSYTGQMGASQITIDKPVTIIGGYAPDFSARDVVAYPTKIQPKNAKNDTKALGIIMLKLPAGPGPAMVIDGLIIDQGFMNSYHDIKGKPEGVETGMWLEPPAKGSKDPFASAKSYSIYAETQGRFEGDIIIQNCIFANAGNFAVNIAKFKGLVKIVNNVFVANRMEACEVSASSAQAKQTVCEFAYNTVLFTWSRTDDFGDMGYGFRCLTGVKSNIHHNLFGLNVFAGVGNDKGDAKTKEICLDNNVFFLNKKADVTAVMSPNIIYLKVDSDEFEDLADFPGMESVEGNIALADPAAFKGIINEAYLTAFLNASYSEKTDYDENSPANLFRSAFGMNKVGTIETKVSMYGNRYPLDDTYKLFGACNGYGAQAIQY